MEKRTVGDAITSKLHYKQQCAHTCSGLILPSFSIELTLIHYLLSGLCAFQQLFVSSKTLLSGTRVKGSRSVTPLGPAFSAQTHPRARHRHLKVPFSRFQHNAQLHSWSLQCASEIQPFSKIVWIYLYYFDVSPHQNTINWSNLGLRRTPTTNTNFMNENILSFFTISG